MKHVNPRWIIVLAAFVMAIAAVFPPGMRDGIEVLAIAGAVYALFLAAQAAKEVEAKNRDSKKIGAFRRGVRILSYALFPVRFGEKDAANTFKEAAGDMKVTTAALGKMVRQTKRHYCHETFEAAMQRMGVTDKDLAQREKSWNFRALLTTFITLMYLTVFVGGSGCAILGKLGAGFDVRMSVMIGLSGFVGAVIFYNIALMEHFRLDQIRRRKLYAFSEFFFKHGGWLRPIWIA